LKIKRQGGPQREKKTYGKRKKEANWYQKANNIIYRRGRSIKFWKWSAEGKNLILEKKGGVTLKKRRLDHPCGVNSIECNRSAKKRLHFRRGGHKRSKTSLTYLGRGIFRDGKRGRAKIQTLASRCEPRIMPPRAR